MSYEPQDYYDEQPYEDDLEVVDTSEDPVENELPPAKPKKPKKPRKPLDANAVENRRRNLAKANMVRMKNKRARDQAKKGGARPYAQPTHQVVYHPPTQSQYGFHDPEAIRSVIRDELRRANKPKVAKPAPTMSAPKAEPAQRKAPTEQEILEKQLLSFVRY